MANSNLLGSSPSDGDEPSANANPSNESSHNRGTAGKQDDRAARPVLTERQCLELLTQMPGLVAMGILTPARANAIRANVAELLRHYARVAHGGHGESQPGLADDVIQGIFDLDPAVLNLLAPLMTDAQVELVMRRAKPHE